MMCLDCALCAEKSSELSFTSKIAAYNENPNKKQKLLQMFSESGSICGKKIVAIYSIHSFTPAKPCIVVAIDLAIPVLLNICAKAFQKSLHCNSDQFQINFPITGKFAQTLSRNNSLQHISYSPSFGCSSNDVLACFTFPEVGLWEHRLTFSMDTKNRGDFARTLRKRHQLHFLHRSLMLCTQHPPPSHFAVHNQDK